ncbi:hypothetical protein [Pleionea sp. CnH1-48]|uniref:hypothetical protein n=1 Tax=Pleionea sp. CnH1-48 TaxID=2954494 RepID=UPI002096D4E9|nr:hypothetical protein [Pleionea sp. CnH1-48]MCO7224047.1 hypothetical protein [Pleionea sp. CnH1-48]
MKTTLIFTACALAVSLGTTAKEFEKSSTISKNENTQIREDIGFQQKDDIAGINGYKEFKPGAIVSANVPSKGATQMQSIKRRGSTDAWLSWVWSWDWKEFGWDHSGSHVSSSDLWEGKIWIDGYLKITTDGGWRETCNNHTSGNYAHCGTRFFQLIPRTIRAESRHYFHSSGYVDQTFNSSDNA